MASAALVLESPLAERMRPRTIGDVVGQEKLLRDGGLLKEIARSKVPANLIFWGPPGSGKTTLARIIARECSADFIELSAVQAKKADVEAVVAKAKTNRESQLQTVLFVDEIHRFNKAQQDAFLPHVESGLITLIGATTENPSFEVIRPLLSRSRVVVLEPLSRGQLVGLLEQALERVYDKKQRDKQALETIAGLSAGDARRALGILELAMRLSPELNQKNIYEAAQASIPAYDKNGEMHYDLVSAFIKSMRGSDETASLYYLSRLLAGGEDPLFIARRMIIFASEDIGLEGNGALSLAVATFQAIERIGLPEAEYTLYHCAAALARSKKSRQVADKKAAAKALEQKYPNAAVPLHLRNAPTRLMKDIGYGKDYQWRAGFQPTEGFLPKEILNNKND